MKKALKLLVFASVVLTTTLNAQRKEPEFIRTGSMVKAIFYHENGAVAQIGCFNLSGKLQGDWVMFAEDGTKISLGSYDNGKRNGEWFYWSKNRDMLREVTYSHGKLISVVQWSTSSPTL